MPDPPSQRDAIVTRITEVRTGAAELSRLLAEEALGGDEWERAARVLASCREERRMLDEDLRQIDGHGSERALP